MGLDRFLERQKELFLVSFDPPGGRKNYFWDSIDPPDDRINYFCHPRDWLNNRMNYLWPEKIIFGEKKIFLTGKNYVSIDYLIEKNSRLHAPHNFTLWITQNVILENSFYSVFPPFSLSTGHLSGIMFQKFSKPSSYQHLELSVQNRHTFFRKM